MDLFIDFHSAEKSVVYKFPLKITLDKHMMQYIWQGTSSNHTNISEPELRKRSTVANTAYMGKRTRGNNLQKDSNFAGKICEKSD